MKRLVLVLTTMLAGCGHETVHTCLPCQTRIDYTARFDEIYRKVGMKIDGVYGCNSDCQEWYWSDKVRDVLDRRTNILFVR